MKTILIILVIVAIKAIFAASETAFTYLNKAKIHQMSKNNKKANKINDMLEKNHKLFGITEVGITICELFATIIAAETFVKSLALKFMEMSIESGIAYSLSIVIVTLVLSYVLLVLGLLLPKRIARNHPEKTVFRLINILSVLSIINYPFEKLVNYSTTVICKIFGIKENEKDILTEKEIKMIITEGKEQGIIDKVEKDILFKTLRYNDILAKDIMIPKEKVDFINIKDDTDKILSNIKKYKYTRIPVYKDNKDNVIGLINIKDIILQIEENKKISIDTEKILRPVNFIEKDGKITTAFKSMQLNKHAMMMVIDKDKKVQGIITMEDLIEEIVGEIRDEYDDDEDDFIRQLSDNEYDIDASIKLDDLNDALDTTLKSNNYDSLGGLVIELLDKLPDEGEIAATENISLKVTQVAKNRIERILLTITENEETEAEEDK